VIKGTVIRDDSVWQGHPDVAYFEDELFIVFRESDQHMTKSTTRIQLVVKSKHSTYSEPVTIAESRHRFNCPRLSVVDNHLWIICDQVQKSKNFIRAENNESKTRIFLWKSKDGRNWSDPIITNITGIVPDRICSTDDGYLIATHTMQQITVSTNTEDNFVDGYQRPQNNGYLVQNIWHSNSLDTDWTKHELCHYYEHNMCEASVCRIGSSYLCLMRENSGLGKPAYFCRSTNGINWTEAKPTRMFACHRPVTGVLATGNLLTTYREASHSFKIGLWAKNTFACLTCKKSAQKDFSDSIILPLDHDNSPHSDSGYTGWVQLPDESIFIVNYITGDAPQPYIRWYQIYERDF